MAALALHLGALTRQETESAEPLAGGDWSMRPGTYIGPFVVGWSFDVLLFGVIFHQVIIWSSHFQAERLVTKLLVIWTFLVSFGVTVFIIHEIWDKFVLNYGVFAPFADPRVHAIYLMLDAAVVVPVQMFYAARASRFVSKKIWLGVPVVVLIAVSVVGTVGGTVTAVQLDAQMGWSTKLDKWLYVLLSSMTAANLLIAVWSTFGLMSSQTPRRQSDQFAVRLIRVGAETFAGPTILALASFLHLVTHGGSLMNVFFECVLGKLHVVSLLGKSA
ncbi:hypothetical protein DB88DRAFT_475488 [Papiliotrema laurentii]|uniref:Uncharacterized protein n=1 Tax=Papiliotrema laurentii TaxID=5418 RepID=A0AAD9FMI0_PAPLA|nr:hypothetical protein DB88DRAFT_475488 [Papiliotrema laurentii]